MKEGVITVLVVVTAKAAAVAVPMRLAIMKVPTRDRAGDDDGAGDGGKDANGGDNSLDGVDEAGDDDASVPRL